MILNITIENNCMNYIKYMLLALALTSASHLYAQIRLPKVIGSNMVLQRDKPITLWGWAEAGEKVMVTFADCKSSATADSNGKWKVLLPAQKANAKPQEIQINDLTIHNILIGDVWLGSGQSNMEWPLRNSENGKAAIAEANNSSIRLFHVPKVQKPEPQSDLSTEWKECTPQNIPSFSAALYYFGRKLNKELDIPIGLINSSWGGSAIEPWFCQDGNMYNGMIAPLYNFAIKGFTWYQGETNVMQKNGLAYYDKQKQLIEGWRQKWNDPELPFYFVQIAPLSANQYIGQLPAFWEAQAKSLSIPKTGMIVTTDIVHDIKNIHPINKLDIGERLARWALAKDYGRQIVYSGPLYKSMQIVDNKIILNFAHVGSGLVSRDNKPLNDFQIAGADGNYVEAKAIIEGESVVVCADGVEKPRNVRFAWHNVATPNLMNREKLPASPFHTDGWQGKTGE